MKRLTALFLGLILVLSGCGVSQERHIEPVTFYYLRAGYGYGGAESVIAPEQREAGGHRDSLSYLLSLYQLGPTEEGLHSPLAPGIRVSSLEQKGSRVLLSLEDPEQAMTDLDFTLACACLSKTILELTDAESVTVTSSARSITMNRENLILYDDVTNNETEETP